MDSQKSSAQLVAKITKVVARMRKTLPPKTAEPDCPAGSTSESFRPLCPAESEKSVEVETQSRCVDPSSKIESKNLEKMETEDDLLKINLSSRDPLGLEDPLEDYQSSGDEKMDESGVRDPKSDPPHDPKSDQPCEVLGAPEVLRLNADLSNLPGEGDALPKTLIYKDATFLDPKRIRLALDFARVYKKIPLSVCTDNDEEIDREQANIAAMKARKALPRVRNRNNRRNQRLRRLQWSAPVVPPPDARLLESIRTLEDQVRTEKAVAHQAHLKVTTLEKELGVANATVTRLRTERDTLKQMLREAVAKIPAAPPDSDSASGPGRTRYKTPH